MLPVAEKLQLRPQKANDGVALADLSFALLKFRRLLSDERAQCRQLILTVQRHCFHAQKPSRFGLQAPVFRLDFSAKSVVQPTRPGAEVHAGRRQSIPSTSIDN